MSKKSEPIRMETLIVVTAIALFGGALIGIYSVHSNWFDRRDAGLPMNNQTVVQPEMPVEQIAEPAPVVQTVGETNKVEVITFNVKPRFSAVPVSVSETNNQRRSN